MIIATVKAISGAVNAFDRTINAVDRSVTLAIRIYDRIEKRKQKPADKQR